MKLNRSYQASCRSHTKQLMINVLKILIITGLSLLLSTCGGGSDSSNQLPTAVIDVDLSSGNAPLTVNFNATNSSDADGSVDKYSWDFGDGQTENGILVEHTFTNVGEYNVTLTVTDNSAASSSATQLIQVKLREGPPPNPASIAPKINNTVATTLASASKFLYLGNNRIQTGVAEGTIDAKRIAVLRGKVKQRNGEPLSGIKITILNHSEFGETITREDYGNGDGGMFDMVVNGGGTLTVDYRKTNFLPVQRQINVPWQDYIWLPDVVMIPSDEKVTTIDLSKPEMQVATSSVVTDDDGARQAVLMIPQGTTAEIALPGGGTQAMSTLNLRATEYTEGDSGPETMPAELPPTSGYTYAVELSVDEAQENGSRVNGKDVVFNQPVPFYVDNFLDFPVGTVVPVGYYDNDKAAWMPSENGIIIGIVDITGGFANLDVDGDDSADTGTMLSDLGITDAEREKLAAQYSAGQSLWRVPLAHLSTWDFNWSRTPDEVARPPGPTQENKPNKPCKDEGSIIECQNQTLGESVPVTGTDFTLNYQSDRVPGHLDSYSMDIPLSGATVPAILLRIELEVSVAGQEFKQSFPPNPNQSYSFTWDGMDAYGRTLQGVQPMSVSVGFTYEGSYQQTDRFGSIGSGIVVTGSKSRQEVTLWRKWTDSIGAWDARGQSLGGWMFDVHHAYDPGGKTLYLGDGSRRSAWSISAIDSVAGNGEVCHSTTNPCGDGGPATKASLYYPTGVAIGPDGSIYLADLNNDRIRSVGPDGIINTVAGTGSRGYSGDGGPATEAQLHSPGGIAIGPDGSIYIADRSNHRIRRVGPDGIITSVAGTGINGYSGDGGLATNAQLYSPGGVAVGPDGSIYIADTINSRIRYIGPDGIISTMAGTTGPGGYSGDGGSATEARLYLPGDVAIGPDGSIYIADTQNNRIRQVRPDGIINTVAGTGTGDYSGDGGPATEAQLYNPEGVAIGPDGSIYIADRKNHRIRRVGPDGIITTVAGTGNNGYSGDGGLPADAQLYNPWGVTIGPDGSIYAADRDNRRIRRIGTPLPGFTVVDIVIPSEDGSKLYHFDATGRHLQTINALTGAVLYDFNYDADGLLLEIVDGDGNSTTITHEASGNPTSIVAPGSQTTDLVANIDNYLESIGNPAGDAVVLTYTNNGLLDTFTDPNGNSSQYTYDAKGLLTLARDRAEGSKSFSRTEDETGYTVTKTTAMERVTTYRMEYLSTGGERSYKEYPDGSWNEVLLGTDGSSIINYSDGTVITMKHGPDPRFGMLAPVMESISIATPSGLTNDITQNRLVTLTNPDDPLSLQSIQDTTTINGRTYTYDYDAATRSLTTTTPQGHQTVSVIDSLGRVTSLNLATGVDNITVNYDAQGLVTQGGQGGQSWTFAYDALDRVISRIDAGMNETLFSYDDADRIVQVDLPGGGTEGYDYDANGNFAQMIMPSGDSHTLTYTPLDSLASYTPPDNPGHKRSYNLDRALVSHTLPGGRVVANSFDADTGQWTGISYPEATVTFTYSPSSGRLANLTRTPSSGAAQSITYGYDGGLFTGQTWSGVAVGAFLYSYDNNFFLTNVTLNSGADSIVTPFSYDTDGLAKGYGPFTLTRGGPGGATSQVSDSALVMAIGYDTLANVQSRSQTINGKSVYNFSVNRDNVGQITQKIETIGGASHTYDYSYDADGQLVNVSKDASTIESYSYDANGNRLSTLVASASYDNQDRLTTHGGISYTFDADGYLTQRGTDTFQYSARGELLSVMLGGTTSITYSYDGLGRQVGRTDASGTYQYLYGNLGNPYLITALRDAAGVLTTLYYDEEGLLFAIERGDSMYYIGTDQVGTPQVVADSTGTVVKLIEYDSFGKRLSDSNPSFALPIGFAGGLEDTATGLVRFGYRDLDQASGRWTARDPVLYDGGQANLYVYVGNNPVGLRDPLGLGECVSFSAYEGVGGGIELCCNETGECSICAEAGFGAGFKVSAGHGAPKDTGTNTLFEIGVSCGGKGLSIKCLYNAKCGLKCVAVGSISEGPFDYDTSSGVKVSAGLGSPQCGRQGKAAAEACKNFNLFN